MSPEILFMLQPSARLDVYTVYYPDSIPASPYDFAVSHLSAMCAYFGSAVTWEYFEDRIEFRILLQ